MSSKELRTANTQAPCTTKIPSPSVPIKCVWKLGTPTPGHAAKPHFPWSTKCHATFLEINMCAAGPLPAKPCLHWTFNQDLPLAPLPCPIKRTTPAWAILPHKVTCTHVWVCTVPLPFNKSCFSVHLYLHLLVVLLNAERQEHEPTLTGGVSKLQWGSWSPQHNLGVMIPITVWDGAQALIFPLIP